MGDAVRPNDDEPLPNSWSQRAGEAAGRDDYEQALAISQQAAEECEQAGRDREAAVAHHRAGMYAYRQGDLEEAEAAYRRSLAIDQRTGDEQGSAQTLNNLSAVASKRGDHDEAVDFLIDSIRIKERLGDERGVAASYHQLGVVAWASGDFTAAVDWYQRSVAASEALGHDHGQAVSCLSLHLLAEGQGDHERSQAWLGRAMRSLDRLGDVDATINLGRDAQRRDEPDEALVLYRKAVEIGRRQDDPSKLALALRYLGVLAEKGEDRATAIACVTEALAIEQELGLEQRIASGRRWLERLNDLVWAAIDQGQDAERREAVDEALAHYRRATELAEAQNAQDKYVLGYQYLGALAGETGDYKTARECFERALAIDQRAGRDEGVAYNRRWLAWLDEASSSEGFL